jgi:hypothetical protein
MTLPRVPSSLQADNLMKHMRVLCKDIGPRASASPQERRAAEYVKHVLGQSGYTDWIEQPFKSRTSIGWVSIPLTVLAIAVIPLALLGGSLFKIIGSVALLLASYETHRLFQMKHVSFEPLIAHGVSQNVAVTIPARTSAKRRLFLIGHLDSNKQRLITPPPDPSQMRRLDTASEAGPALLGVILLISALVAPETPAWLWLIGALTLLSLLIGLYLTVRDERQPHVEGANDNATAVSILLGAAEALKEQPLHNTEVTLLFTGCEEVGCTGLTAYVEHFKPSLTDSVWFDLEMVGTGRLCYVTKHGVSYLTDYTPDPMLVKVAEQTAQAQPELDVIGKEMLIVEEVAVLRNRGYSAICLAGYNAQGYLPNWHRVSDTLANIEPATLERAAHYTWAFMQTLDAVV